MPVNLQGDYNVVVESGELQDFEQEVRRDGRHSVDEFRIIVERSTPGPGIYAIRYVIKVDRISADGSSQRGAIYGGGHGEAWVARFAEALAAGQYEWELRGAR